MTTHKSELTISRLINAPLSTVWKAWSDPRHFEKWWIPEPTKCKVIKMDMRPGGAFETQMSEDGSNFQPHVEGCFLDIVPQARIVFSTALVEGWRPADDPWLAMTAIMTMEEEGGATRYTARALHKSEVDSRKHEEMGFEDGWGTCIDQLGKIVEKLA